MLNAQPSSRLLRSGVPACLTLGSMLCGYLSVTYTLSGTLTRAAWLIVCAGVLDALDGPVSRALGGASKFGAELDSFADLVSFGVAPSVLVYHAYFLHWGIRGMLVSFLPTMAGALRLTRYNITTTSGSREYWVGFSTTAGGNLLASFLLFSHAVWHGRDLSGLAAALVLLTSLLMTSRIRYSSLARFAQRGPWFGPKIVLCLVVGVSLALFPDKAFFPAMVVLMLEGMLSRPIGQAVRQVGEIRRQHRNA